MHSRSQRTRNSVSSGNRPRRMLSSEVLFRRRRVQTVRTLAAVALLAFMPVAFAAPVPKEILKKFEDLEGTTWSGDGVVAPTVYIFLKGGVLSYSYNGATHTAGSWKQDGNKIYWETNNKYCEFDGTFENGAMTGKAHNVANGKWDLKMTKAK